jgi:hypothetical protein
MFVLVLGLVLTAGLLVRAGFKARQPAAIGAMSQQWITDCQASQPASSR